MILCRLVAQRLQKKSSSVCCTTVHLELAAPKDPLVSDWILELVAGTLFLAAC